MCYQDQTKLYGGYAKKVTNAKIWSTHEIEGIIAHIALTKLFYPDLTTWQPLILRLQHNGIHPKTEQLHQKMSCQDQIRRPGGYVIMVMNGERLFPAETRELDVKNVIIYVEEVNRSK